MDIDIPIQVSHQYLHSNPNTYTSFAFEQLHWVLQVSRAERKGANSIGRLVLKPCQQLVQS